MKRKAIQLANNTIVVSLPSKWVRQNSVNKGDDLDVEAKERILIIRKMAASGSDLKRVKIDISGMSSSLIWNYLNTTYRTGFDEIELFFSDTKVRDIKTGKTQKTMDLISRITDKLIGMEIIRQSRNSCVLKEITQLNGDEYDNVMNRIFLSLVNISRDVLAGAKEGDRETLENLYMYSEINLNKLSDYCMRILNIQGLRDFKESNANYLMTFLLEEVGDVYANIARIVASNPKSRFTPETVSLFERTNSILTLSHKMFLNPKKDYYISFHEERNSIKKKADSLLSSGKRADTEVLFWLKVILDKLMEINNTKLTAIDGL